MIYNFVEYLKTELPTEKIFTNTKEIQVPERCVFVKENGGDIQPWVGYTQKMIQIITRDIDAVRARELSYSVKNKLHDKFGLILPAVTVNGSLYDSLQSAQITAEQEPQSIGYDENGNAEYSTNYKIIFRRD
jgi:hypothetical protein